MVYLTDGKRHLVCVPFSVENLHAMGRDLGIDRAWYHPGRYPHYDVPKKRQVEIESRCEIVSARDILKIIRGDPCSATSRLTS